MELIQRVEQAILRAESGQSKLQQDQLDHNILPGMSGRKSRILLNELVNSDTVYLEVGTYVGSTFISACYRNQPLSVQAIDFFTEIGQGVRDQFWANIEKNREHLPAFEFFEENCFDLSNETKSKLNNINCFFFDGPHREQDQCQALVYYRDFLSDSFIFIVDDWNWPQVKDGTYRGIQEADLEILRSWELLSGGGDHNNWWNSWFIAVLKKQG